MNTPISIGPFSFDSTEAANRELSQVLHSVPDNGEYLGEARRLVEAVFNARAEKVAQKGRRQVIRFRRGRSVYGTACFYADLDDGTTLDFSFMKLLAAATDRAA